MRETFALAARCVKQNLLLAAGLDDDEYSVSLLTHFIVLEEYFEQFRDVPDASPPLELQTLRVFIGESTWYVNLPRMKVTSFSLFQKASETVCDT